MDLRYSWRHVGMVAVILVVGAAISLGMFAAALTAEERRITEQFDYRVNWRASDIEYKLRANFSVLSGVAAMVATSPVPSAEAIERFVRSRVAYGGQSPRSVIWAPYIPAVNRARFEAATRARGLDSYTIVEPDEAQPGRIVHAGERTEYFPTLLNVRFDGERRGLGIDAAYNDQRRQAIQRAIDTGGFAIIGLTSVVATIVPRAPGITVYEPVYASPAIPERADERRAASIGVVGAAFDLADLLNYAIANTPIINQAIYLLRPGPAEGDRPRIIAAYEPGVGRFASTIEQRDLDALQGYRTTHTFTIGDETWRLLFHFTPEQMAEGRTPAPWAWLALGILITSIVAGGAVVAIKRAADLRRLVRERTALAASLDAQLSERVAIINASPMAIVVVGADGAVRRISPAAERMYGIPAEDAVGRTALTAGTAEFYPAMRRVLSGEAVAGFEYAARAEEGKTTHFRVSGAPLRDAAQQVTGAVFLAEDITQQKVTSEQLLHAQKLETVGQLTGGMAHDFNNLLGVIIGNLEMLDRRIDDSGRKELLADSLTAALKGAELTRSLLAFARRQPLRATTFDVNAALGPMTALIERTIGEQYKIELRLAPDLWPAIADVAQLEAAILNLCVNSRDAMPAGGTLTIETCNAYLDEDYVAYNHEARAGAYVGISVTDSGTGMSEDVIAHALEPFFTTKEVGKGSGLGLSMVFGFVKQSGGHFKLYSEPGEGTTVKIYLPRAASLDASLPAAPAQAEPLARGHETILVVDDNEQIRKVAVKQLQELGYATIEAPGGPAALRALADGTSIDLLFTDIVMPSGMSGYDLARAACESRPDLKVLLTSGFPAAAHPCAELGPLLNKPYRRDELARRVRAALDAGAEDASGTG